MTGGKKMQIEGKTINDNNDRGIYVQQIDEKSTENVKHENFSFFMHTL